MDFILWVHRNLPAHEGGAESEDPRAGTRRRSPTQLNRGQLRGAGFWHRNGSCGQLHRPGELEKRQGTYINSEEGCKVSRSQRGRGWPEVLNKTPNAQGLPYMLSPRGVPLLHVGDRSRHTKLRCLRFPSKEFYPVTTRSCWMIQLDSDLKPCQRGSYFCPSGKEWVGAWRKAGFFQTKWFHFSLPTQESV